MSPVALNRMMRVSEIEKMNERRRKKEKNVCIQLMRIFKKKKKNLIFFLIKFFVGFI